MAVRIPLLFSLLAVAVVAGFSQPLPAGAEPLKIEGDHLPVPPTLVNSWKVTAVALPGAPKGGARSVSSAVSRLDLSKLTMADFGDVEQSR